MLDEVRPAEPLHVFSCEGQWCRVRFGEAEGYVRAIVVRGLNAEVKAGASERDCFSASQPGGAKWQTERFCQSSR
ncbi:hypothetical protein HNR51_003238 [Methylorubrum thiocyanatum]|uniref:SH3 domain-containing protein n=1 Tax=Methylorubrum thiocyanatum TaxID=47958 RepID=A0AA40VD18_9HYPH|nr:hypothetical protein [Methylorubrum thiocyanatum]